MEEANSKAGLMNACFYHLQWLACLYCDVVNVCVVCKF